MNTTTKAIATEIWSVKGDKCFSGKDTLVFVNRLTGKIEEYQKVSTEVKQEFVIQNGGTSELDTEDVYGCNGFKRARWIEARLNSQSSEDEE